MSQEAKRIAHQIAADLIDPDALTDIIGDYKDVTDELFPAVREALLELRQELLEDADEYEDIELNPDPLAQEDHTELLRKLREGKDLFDMTTEELLNE